MKCFPAMMLIMATAATECHAQSPMPVTATWEISTDSGATWSAGSVNVPITQTAVRARYMLTWGTTPSNQEFFNTAVFSPTISGVDGAGMSDTVTNIRGVQLTLGPLPANIQGRRWRVDEIKIGSDDSPPPNGPVSLNGFDALQEIYYFGNPVSILEYDLQLDGSLGSRRLSAVWRPRPSNPSNPFALSVVSFTPGPLVYSYTFNDATLVVIPAPASLALPGVASAMLLCRRRSQS
jgi:hypothetical protein